MTKELPVPGTNIKQVEAAERSKIVKVKSYRIDLDLTTGAENFRVKTTVAFAGLTPGATTFIHRSLSLLSLCVVRCIGYVKHIVWMALL